MNLYIIKFSILLSLISCNDNNVTSSTPKPSQVHHGIEIYDNQRLKINGKLEPPAPDPLENNASILGVDSNNDGVRDDVERWINRVVKKWGNSKYKRMFLRLHAKNTHMLLKSSEISGAKLKSLFLTLSNKHDSCVSLYTESVSKDIITDGFSGYYSVLDKLIINNKLRIDADELYNRRLHGFSYVLVDLEDAHKYCNLEKELKKDQAL